MPYRLNRLVHLSLAATAVFNATPSYAQSSPGVLEEIVVTAQRREQNLQDVPVSVTTFGGAELQQRNITNAVDYLALTPGVSFTEDGQTGSRGMGIAVRGVNSLVTGENAFVNSIGIYLDDFSVASVPNNVANPQPRRHEPGGSAAGATGNLLWPQCRGRSPEPHHEQAVERI